MEKIYGILAALVVITRLRDKRQRKLPDYGSRQYWLLLGEITALDEVLAEIDWCDTRGEEVSAASLMKSAVA